MSLAGRAFFEGARLNNDEIGSSLPSLTGRACANLTETDRLQACPN